MCQWRIDGDVDLLDGVKLLRSSWLSMQMPAAQKSFPQFHLVPSGRRLPLQAGRGRALCATETPGSNVNATRHVWTLAYAKRVTGLTVLDQKARVLLSDKCLPV